MKNPPARVTGGLIRPGNLWLPAGVGITGEIRVAVITIPAIIGVTAIIGAPTVIGRAAIVIIVVAPVLGRGDRKTGADNPGKSGGRRGATTAAVIATPGAEVSGAAGRCRGRHALAGGRRARTSQRRLACGQRHHRYGRHHGGVAKGRKQSFSREHLKILHDCLTSQASPEPTTEPTLGSPIRMRAARSWWSSTVQISSARMPAPGAPGAMKPT